MDAFASSKMNRYWGKADAGYPGEPNWRPLLQHCLDVTAVGTEYLRRAPAQQRLFAQAPQLLNPQGSGS